MQPPIVTSYFYFCRGQACTVATHLLFTAKYECRTVPKCLYSPSKRLWRACCLPCDNLAAARCGVSPLLSAIIVCARNGAFPPLTHPRGRNGWGGGMAGEGDGEMWLYISHPRPVRGTGLRAAETYPPSRGAGWFTFPEGLQFSKSPGFRQACCVPVVDKNGVRLENVHIAMFISCKINNMCNVYQRCMYIFLSTLVEENNVSK